LRLRLREVMRQRRRRLLRVGIATDIGRGAPFADRQSGRLRRELYERWDVESRIRECASTLRATVRQRVERWRLTFVILLTGLLEPIEDTVLSILPPM